MIRKLWLAVLLAELFLFIFFQPSEECSRAYYFYLFIFIPSGLQAILLAVYHRLIKKRRDHYSERRMLIYAVGMITGFDAILVCVHTSVPLMPVLLIMLMIPCPLYKDWMVIGVQGALAIIIYCLDYFWFIPHSPYMPPLNAFIEISIFVSAVLGSLIEVYVVNNFSLMEEERSKTDSLTHLYNHEFFYEGLEYARERFADKGEIFSIIVADIDNFKKVNDTYGHAFGDCVIKKVADIFSEVGENAFCARYGGEEFAMILPGADKDLVVATAEQIRRRFAAFEFTTKQGSLRFTLSLGAAVYNKVYPSATSFFEQADQALYRAKNNGKNQVQI
jgi:diguanylate cyclase (GGDEF)-like protein